MSEAITHTLIVDGDGVILARCQTVDMTGNRKVTRVRVSRHTPDYGRPPKVRIGEIFLNNDRVNPGGRGFYAETPEEAADVLGGFLRFVSDGALQDYVWQSTKTRRKRVAA